ncbi:hypothetical protein EXM22_05610 [Oceanispirochaeta crateris]|uniref:Uncharacterized protein n=1 Tax=Oceanispirochaeta crateris TaxID=2518645 RepID=A0A5C1QJZ0_9SPIO|nr:hypothetical protein [Oceanispirochaeta crateris]QEN07489.1 hypothetical protein EXM22_05610 [Oceanispirochaeta crateris]
MKHIFYIKWKENSLVLNECNAQNLIENLSEENIELAYGESVTDQDLDLIKTELKIDIENAVNRWINDSRFFVHLLMSTGVFLVSYYFLSYVVRDPIPLVDEIVLSLLMAGLSWYRLKNQQYKTDKVIHKKIEMEQYLSDIPYVKNDFIVQVELYLEKLSSMGIEEQKSLFDSGAVPVFFTSSKKDLIKLLRLLEKFGSKNPFSKEKRLPPEINELKKQMRSFLKYHSSMV